MNSPARMDAVGKMIGELQKENEKLKGKIGRQGGIIKRLEVERDRAQKLADARLKTIERLDVRRAG